MVLHIPLNTWLTWKVNRSKTTTCSSSLLVAVRNAAELHLAFSRNPHSLAGLKMLNESESFEYTSALVRSRLRVWCHIQSVYKYLISCRTVYAAFSPTWKGCSTILLRTSLLFFPYVQDAILSSGNYFASKKITYHNNIYVRLEYM